VRKSVRGAKKSAPVASLGRVLLKITGECFITPERLKYVVGEIGAAVKTECELAIVVGGGNVVRGRDTRLADRIAADYAGMVATIANGIILQSALNEQGIPAAHLSSFEIAGFVARFSRRLGLNSLSSRHVLVLSGGTGNPLFSTDSAAALRARELKVEAVLKGTKVRGVFSADPEKHPEARFLSRLTYEEVLQQRLAIMDPAAFALCAEPRLPIVVFDLFEAGNLVKIVKGEKVGSIIC
jgi:uridylate kinase